VFINISPVIHLTVCEPRDTCQEFRSVSMAEDRQSIVDGRQALKIHQISVMNTRTREMGSLANESKGSPICSCESLILLRSA